MHTKVINFLDTEEYTTTGVLNISFTRCNVKIEQWLESTDETTVLYDGNPFIADPSIIEICDVNISDISAGDIEFLVYQTIKTQINEDTLHPIFTIIKQLKIEEEASLINSDIG